MKRYLSALMLLLASACVSPYQGDYEAALASGQKLFISVAYTVPPSAHQISGEFYSDAANLTKKTIKYLKYNLASYNSVGDRVGEVTKTSVTGPAPEGITISWSDWVKSSCVVIQSIRVEYTDGTSLTYGSPSEVQSIMRSGLKNSCEI